MLEEALVFRTLAGEGSRGDVADGACDGMSIRNPK